GELPADHVVGGGHSDRPACVPPLSNLRHERQLGEKLNAEASRQGIPAARSEDLLSLAALRTNVVAHVLYDSQQRYLQLAEHPDAPLDVSKRDFLRRCDDRRPRKWHLLRERERGVSRARRHVDDQIVLLAP